MYLQPEEVHTLIAACAERFPGGTLLFDAIPHPSPSAAGRAAWTRRGLQGPAVAVEHGPRRARSRSRRSTRTSPRSATCVSPAARARSPWPRGRTSSPASASSGCRSSRSASADAGRRNIASVPWRCGQNWAYGPSPRPGTSPGTDGASRRSTSSRSRSTSSTTHAGLGDVRRAGDVGDDAAGAYGVQRRVEQPPLQRAQLGDGLRATPPAGLRAAAQRAQAAARHVGEDPVEGAGPPGGPGAVDDGDRRARAVRGRAAARCGWTSQASRRAPRSPASAGQQRGLAARAGAQVEPARVRAVELDAGEGEGDELARLVLHGGAALGDGAGRSPGRLRAGRRRTGSTAAGSPSSSSTVERPGRATSVTRGRSLSAASRSSISAAPTASRSALTIQRGWLCTTDETPGLVLRRDDLQPGVEVAGRHLAQHGVGELRLPRTRHRTRQVDGGADGRVRRDAGAQQLVRAEPQDVQQRRVDLGRPGGRCTCRSRRRTCRGRAACRTSARWRARRRGRSGRVRAAAAGSMRLA